LEAATHGVIVDAEVEDLGEIGQKVCPHALRGAASLPSAEWRDPCIRRTASALPSGSAHPAGGVAGALLAGVSETLRSA
jgi:hypothetical protein